MENLVFIIDDDQVYLDFMKSHFAQMKQYQLEVYRGGEEALAALEIKTPSLIILDHHLVDPTKDGIYFLKKIRKVKPSTPVIYITSNNTDAVKRDAIAGGARSVIVKSESFLVQLRTAIDGINSEKQGFLAKLLAKLK
jgi:CheY-like chemotaxis protein